MNNDKPDGVVMLHGREYKTVALRVQEFRRDHPGLSIVSEILEMNDESVVMVARVLDESGRVVATGHAEKRRNESHITRTSCLEVCETAAIGRALASYGYGGSEFASADEVADAMSAQREMEVDSGRLRQLMRGQLGVDNQAKAEALVRFVTEGRLGVEAVEGRPGDVLAGIRVAWEASGRSYEGVLDAALEWWKSEDNQPRGAQQENER